NTTFCPSCPLLSCCHLVFSIRFTDAFESTPIIARSASPMAMDFKELGKASCMLFIVLLALSNLGTKVVCLDIPDGAKYASAQEVHKKTDLPPLNDSNEGESFVEAAYAVYWPPDPDSLKTVHNKMTLLRIQMTNKMTQLWIQMKASLLLKQPTLCTGHRIQILLRMFTLLVAKQNETLVDSNEDKSFAEAAYAVYWPPDPDSPKNVHDKMTLLRIQTKASLSLKQPTLCTGHRIQILLRMFTLLMAKQNDDNSVRTMHPATRDATPNSSDIAEAARQALKVKRGMLFPKRSMYPGAVLPAGTKLMQQPRSSLAPSLRFVSRAEASTVPFGHEHLDAILARFGIPKGSKKADQVSETLTTCKTVPMTDPHTCATSWQSMGEFAAASLGAGTLRPARTVVYGEEEELDRYVVAPNGVTEIGGAGDGNGLVPCHPMPYPYEVFFCHRPKDTRAFRVELDGKEDGARRATAVAVCHMDTSDWDGRYFEMLGARPGEPICHLMPQRYVLWIGSP
ncbi:hypothetical protein EJB05_41745, partial [Eragrostis curvula]